MLDRIKQVLELLRKDEAKAFSKEIAPIQKVSISGIFSEVRVSNDVVVGD